MSLNLSLEVNDVNTVLAGLAELPAKTSYDVINRVKSQAEAQLVAQQSAPVAEAAPAQQELLTEG